ncbi:MAG: zinc metalloprotease HtpX [Proteobacteria bacterium]|nr:zinc metalloprotease HtpX [Pseudomonadota bacterium]MBU1546718.1 zinc metalloprotease HtpX [Pseudomonadota bacterium]MBU2618523.1 zinc metalloprotease HtpX [Pseudomonadota bacterium]
MGNTIKTGMLMAALTALFMVAGQAMGGQSGMTVALLMALAMNFFAYWFSDKLALKMGGAREIEQSEAPVLHSLVAGLAMRAGLPKPRVYVIDSDTPNAFATGRNPAHAAVAVTRGLMTILTRDELEGVLAHELAHIKNRDILISSMAAVMAGAISSLATMTQWAMLFGMGRSADDEDNGGMLGTIVMMIIAPIGAALIQMAISRSREYLADATGAQICGHPSSLANALKRLEEVNHQRPMEVNPATAQMYIVNPLSAGTLANLFSTHPPMQERIRRLLAIR